MASNMIRKHKRTNIFVMDEDLWAWAQYRAKILNFQSVSEYLFALIRKDKEKNILTKKGE